jgi:ribosome-associated translation inhibitor RaiA
MDTSVEFLIRAGQVNTADALRDYAERRLSFALRRFAHRVQHVMVRLVDVNGPRRGIDSRCSMTAHLVDGRRIFVEASAAWPFAAITRAAHRLNESIRRERGRHGGRGENPGATPGRHDFRQLGRVS